VSFYTRRKRADDLARREAAGESLWTTNFSLAFRVRLLHAFQQAGQHSHVPELLELAQHHLAPDLGRPFLSKNWLGSPLDDIDRFISTDCTDHEMPALIEALWAASCAMRGPSVHYAGTPIIEPWDQFATAVRELLYEERLAYDLVGGRVVDRQAEAMHQGVVAPTLTLLSGRAGFDGAERAYRKALEELARDDPADAITDAVRALQETMEALGWEGNTIGKKFDWALARGKVAPHDRRLVEAVTGWTNADRSERGDAHKETELTRADAQLTINIAGALILRLAEL
jgi:hypothetical protein